MSEKSKKAKAIFEELSSDGSLHYVPHFTSMSGPEHSKFVEKAKQKMVKRIQKVIDEMETP